MTHSKHLRRRRGAAAALAVLLSSGAPGSATAAPATALNSRLGALERGESLVIAGEQLVSHRALPSLYRSVGGGQLLWSDPARRAALLATLRESALDGLRPQDYHLAALEQLASDGGGARPGRAATDFDVLATDAYVLLLYHLYLGKVDPVSIEPQWNLPLRGVRETEALGFVRHAFEAGTIAESAASLRPKHWLYEHGRAALARYRQIAAAGGWPAVTAGRKLEPGMHDPRVPVLRRRLAITDDYRAPASDSVEYEAALVEALRAFQRRHLLTADGVLGAATLRELNVPVAARIDQLRINLERGRWVLHEIGEEDLVVVDVAGFDVRYLRNRQRIWRARVIVGQPFRQTPVFRAAIDSVIFNPTWTVPPGILAKDVLPQMQQGENVLARKKLKLYDRSGGEVDPAGVDWSPLTVRDFPYVLRQDAGDGNALGRVKINFPNPYLVYLHDTPTRSLFDRDNRSFSSGCIRVERPLELVELLLNDPAQWNAAAIQAAVDSGQTRVVTLARRIPVLLMYWTVDEDGEGRTIFKRDVYRRDPRLLRALNGKFRFGTRLKT